VSPQREASHPLFYRVGSRRLRRWAMVGMYGGWLLISVLVTLKSLTIPGWIWATNIVVLMSLLFQLVWFVWLGRTYVNAPRLADAELDERLLQVKNQAYRRAYLVLAPTAVVLWILSLFALEWQPNDHGRIIATMLVFGVAQVAGTLPTAIVAWREPDPEPLEA
jgi:hypothetical protein